MTDDKDSAYGGVFTNSPQNSIFTKIYQNNMDENSYVGYGGTIGLHHILNNKETAYFDSQVTVEPRTEYFKCQVMSNYLMNINICMSY